MHELFGKIPYIGTLYFDDIFLFYDEPQIFSCITASFQKYFGLLIDEDDNYREWLLTAISDSRLTKAKNNAIEIRNLLTESEADFIFDIKLQNQFSAKSINKENLTDDMLPCKGEYLDYSENQSNVNSDFSVIAEESWNEHRDIINISMEKDDNHSHEIDCSLLGNILDVTQELIYALANKDGGIKGKVPSEIKKACTMQVCGTYAASFGVKMKSDELCNINRETPLTPALYKINNLFSVCSNKEELARFLLDQSPRVALKYRKLLKILVNSNTGLKFSNASPNRKHYGRSFSTLELSSNLQLIESEIKKMTKEMKFKGQLVGINTVKKTFSFISFDKEIIKGTLSTEVASKQFEVPQYVEIKVMQSIDYDPFCSEDKYAYELQKIDEITPKESDK